MEEEKKHTSKLKKHISLADWHDCMLIYHAMCQSHHKVNKNEIVHILKSVEIIYKKMAYVSIFLVCQTARKICMDQYKGK